MLLSIADDGSIGLVVVTVPCHSFSQVASSSCRFIAMPVSVIIAYHGIDKWAREKVINGIQRSICLVGHLLFLVSERS